ncbi:MAG: dual specificity protein phosphatase family protein [Desulfobulbaceae bacterium]|jgi:protein-tyrosine phosphatase|nr:dual specificity protein phosphatase family protein [Desulfobulbaceae bacterium]
MDRPIKHCYWVAPGKLLAGEYPRNIDEASSPQKLKALIQAGVTAFIDLTEDHELSPYSEMIESVSYQRFPVKDRTIPTSIEKTTAILDAIDHHIAQGEIVYVHCWGGVGRTGTIIGCWLSRHGSSGKAAYDQLQELWKACPKSVYRISPESDEQKEYLMEWREK